MLVSAIVAMGANGEIGLNGQLPWPRIVADMERFQQLTMGCPIICGAATYEKLPVLDDRILTVMNNTLGGLICHRCSNPAEWIGCNRESAEGFVIGGAKTFRSFWPMTERIYLTVIYREFEADTFMCKMHGKWRATAERLFVCEHGWDVGFFTLERVSK